MSSPILADSVLKLSWIIHKEVAVCAASTESKRGSIDFDTSSPKLIFCKSK